MNTKVVHITFVLAALCVISALSQPVSTTNRERTFIMLKPEAVQRGLVGQLIKRFEAKGLKLVAMNFRVAATDLLETHYAHLSDRAFFAGLIKAMSSSPVVPMVFEGENAVKIGRAMLGATDPIDSAPGTIRGDFAINVARNVAHASSSVENAAKEINLWFNENELINWQQTNEVWIYEE
jgi:nucleoside-diphosphate kinase